MHILLISHCSANSIIQIQIKLIELNNSGAQLKTMVLNYIIHLKKIGKQSQVNQREENYLLTVLAYLKGVKSFLEFNEMALPWSKIAKFYPDDLNEFL